MGEYELLMADIFDHLYSIVPYFELSIYERQVEMISKGIKILDA